MEEFNMLNMLLYGLFTFLVILQYYQLFQMFNTGKAEREAKVEKKDRTYCLLDFLIKIVLAVFGTSLIWAAMYETFILKFH